MRCGTRSGARPELPHFQTQWPSRHICRKYRKVRRDTWISRQTICRSRHSARGLTAAGRLRRIRQLIAPLRKVLT